MEDGKRNLCSPKRKYEHRVNNEEWKNFRLELARVKSVQTIDRKFKRGGMAGMNANEVIVFFFSRSEEMSGNAVTFAIDKRLKRKWSVTRNSVEGGHWFKSNENVKITDSIT